MKRSLKEITAEYAAELCKKKTRMLKCEHMVEVLRRQHGGP